MKRFFCLLVALVCVAVLSQVAVFAQAIVVDNGTDASVYDQDADNISTLVGGGLTAGVSINGNGLAAAPSSAGAVDILGTSVNLIAPTNITGATNIVGATAITGTLAVSGAITGDVIGNLTGDVTGNVTGNLTGDVTGDVTGNLTGDVTGNLTGNVTGDVTGNLTGNVTGDVTGNLTGNVTGDVTGNLTGNVIGNLTGNVTGGTISGTTITATGLISGVGLDAGGAGITNAGAISGATTITATGLISGVGLAAGAGQITGSGGANITGTTQLETLNVSGVTTLDELVVEDGATIEGGATILSGSGGINDNRIIVNDDIVSMRSSDWTGAQSVVVDADGARMLSGDRADDNYVRVEDDLVTLGGRYSGLTIEGATSENANLISLVSTNDENNTEGISALTMDPTSASLMVNTPAQWIDDGEGGFYVPGVSHGLWIDQEQTVLSGGTNSTSLTLDDFGATFDNDGAPATVTGVADGIAPFDAVNRRQLDGIETRLSAGIASIAALNAIPCPVPGKNSCVGVGYGNYNGEAAFAVGAKVNIPESNVSVAAGMGFSSSSSPAANAGVSISF